MKVLCLHGKGTSGAILQSQISSFRSRLTDLNITYDYLDGQYPCDPAPGVDLFYPPPYYSYLREDGLEATQEAITWLADYIKRNGPYDALIAFSQGCAVAASLLLQHYHNLRTQNGSANTTPPASPPLKAAIFICGGPPLPFLEHVGYTISPSVWASDQRSRAVLQEQADSAALLEKGNARWTGGEDALSPAGEEEVRRELGAAPVRIGIPTVHVYGTRDPRYRAGVMLSGVCEGGERRRVYNHGGGHEIPRTGEVSGRIERLVRWAIEEGRLV